MNAVVNSPIEADPPKALTVAERAVIAVGISAEREQKLTMLAASTASITAITNTDGREQVFRARVTLKNERVDIQNQCKVARQDAIDFQKACLALERRVIGLIEPEEQRLQGLQDQWDAARETERKAKEEANRLRVADIQKRIAVIEAMPERYAEASASKIAEIVGTLEGGLTFDYQEFSGLAETARQAALVALRQAHIGAVEREEKVAAESAERARIEAEQKAAREAQEQRQAQERAQQEAAAKIAREAEEHRLAEARARLEAEQAERQRRERISEAISKLRPAALLSAQSDPLLIVEHINKIEAIVIDDTFEEFRGQASATKVDALDKLRALHAAATARVAEEERLRQERAEIDRQRREIEEREQAQRAAEQERQQREAAEREKREQAEAEHRAAQERRQAMLDRGAPTAVEIVHAVSDTFAVDEDVAATWIAQTPHAEWMILATDTPEDEPLSDADIPY